MSLFPDEDVLTKEIETWRGFIDKLPAEEDKVVLTKLLDSCHKYSVAMNAAQTGWMKQMPDGYFKMTRRGKDSIIIRQRPHINFRMNNE